MAKRRRPRERTQEPLAGKFWHKGMSRTNYRKLGERRNSRVEIKLVDVTELEMSGTTFNAQIVPQYCNMRKG